MKSAIAPTEVNYEKAQIFNTNIKLYFKETLTCETFNA